MDFYWHTFAMNGVDKEVRRQLGVKEFIEAVNGKYDSSIYAKKCNNSTQCAYMGIPFDFERYYDNDGVCYFSVILPYQVDLAKDLSLINEYNKNSDHAFSLYADRNGKLILKRETWIGKDSSENDMAMESLFCIHELKKQLGEMKRLLEQLRRNQH